jgi:PAS domain-containing protein
VFTIYDGLGQIDIQLNNRQANPTSVIQALSGLSFVLSTGQTSGSLLSMSGTQRTINSDGSYSDGSTINSGWVLQTGSVLRLCVLCAGGTGPDYTLIGPEGADADSLYNNANGSIAGNGPHNPFFGDSLSFSLSVPGLTSDSAISSATFFFGTTEGQDFVTVGGCTVDCGGPTRTPQNTVPEPSTFILFGLALLGFSVVAAVLLMRTRVRATRNEARLRSDIGDLQVQADRLRALLFAEPQILISWAAGDDRPQISGDTSLLMPQESQQHRPQRILAFGTWLPPEPALQMDHAVDALREAGEGFLLNLSTSNGRAIEAMGRAIGGQAIVRIRELGGLRRELAEANLRYKALQEETELLRDFAAAAPWPIWAKSAQGDLRYANPAYVKVTDARSAADAIHRNLELLESDQCADMSRALNDNAAWSARLPVVLGGERRTYDVQAMKFQSGSAAIAVDASEVAQLKAALQRMAEAHRRTLDQLSSGVAVFDAKTGAQVWRWYTIPEAPTDQGKDKKGVTIMGPAGGAVWSTVTIHPDANRLYVTTGNQYTPPASRFPNAIVALELSTGKTVWSYQATPGDIWTFGCANLAECSDLAE